MYRSIVILAAVASVIVAIGGELNASPERSPAPPAPARAASTHRPVATADVTRTVRTLSTKEAQGTRRPTR